MHEPGKFNIKINAIQNDSYVYALSKVLPTGRLKWIDPKKSDLDECSSISSKRYVLEVHLNILKNYVSCTMINSFSSR